MNRSILSRSAGSAIKFLIVLSSTVAMTAAFGQSPLVLTTYVWTNQFPGHLAGVGDMNQATNWSPNGVPNPMSGPDSNGVSGDLALFDGRTTGPLSITQSGGVSSGSGGQSYPAGLRIQLTSNQTSSVTIMSPGGTSSGLRMNWFTIDTGAGGLNVGQDSTVDVLDIVAGEINGQPFGFTNNSATPSVINPDVRWRMGGAGFHPYIFAGVGDWTVRNHMRSTASSAIGIQIEGPGTVTWYGTNVGLRSANWADPLGSPLRVNGGTLILKSSDLISTDAGTVAVVHNGALLKFDSQPTPGLITDPATIPGAISGSGPIQINAGTFTFTGASTFTGPINLTGGEWIAGRIENIGVSGPLGQGGLISFGGGTLGWNLTNAFDYSSRFDTAPGQIYNLDTGGSNPTLATGLTSVGGTLNKTGGGTLTLAGANTYSGLTTVGAGGQLRIQGTKSGTGDITIADSGILGVVENGSLVTPNILTLGFASGAVLEFNNVTNIATAPLAAGTLSSVGTITININSGMFTAIGQSFPLLSWTGGSAPAVALGTVVGADGHLSTNGNTIQFNVDAVPLFWTGASNSNWSDSGNWSTTYSDSQPVQFDDAATGTTSVTVDVPVHPVSVVVNNGAKTYSISSSGANNIADGTRLTKSGNGTLTLSGGANTYTGITTLNGGTLVVGTLSNGGAVSDMGAAGNASSNIVFDGGTLRYTGAGVSMNRSFSVGSGGGTIDNESVGALVFNNSGALGMTGDGPRTLTLTGPNDSGDTIASAIVNHPSGTSLRKEGAGRWILTGTNSYGGVTTVADGILQIGAGGSSGTLGSGMVTNNSVLVFNRTGTLTVSGPIRGTGSVTNDGTGTVILANDNTYSGGTTINAGTLQLGTGLFNTISNGSLNPTAPIVNNSLLVFNTSGTFTYGPGGFGIISGIGNVIVQGGGFIKAIGNNTYSGWTRIDANTTFQPHEGQDGGLVSPVITNNGTLRLATQNSFEYPGRITGSGRLQILANALPGIITLTGTNNYTGGTLIGLTTLVLGDGNTPGAGAIAGNVQFIDNFSDAPRTIVFNRPDDFTFSGTITTNFTGPQINQGIVRQDGTGTLTLTGKNTYGSGTIINAGTVQVGNGGTNGSIGFGPVTDDSILVFNRSDDVTVSSVISGSGAVVKLGAGRLLLTATNTYIGLTTVSNGTLGGNGVISGPVSLEPGTTLAPGASVGTLTINNNLTLGGHVAIEVNKSLAQSNDLVVVTGTPVKTGTGTLTVSNLGPALRVGDKFTLFSQPLQNGAALSVTGAGATWSNQLAVDGSINVVAVTRPTLNFTNLGDSLRFSWNTNLGTYQLQSQTNNLNLGLTANWADYPGGSPVTVPIGITNETVFFRLVSP